MPAMKGRTRNGYNSRRRSLIGRRRGDDRRGQPEIGASRERGDSPKSSKLGFSLITQFGANNQGKWRGWQSDGNNGSDATTVADRGLKERGIDRGGGEEPEWCLIQMEEKGSRVLFNTRAGFRVGSCASGRILGWAKNGQIEFGQETLSLGRIRVQLG